MKARSPKQEIIYGPRKRGTAFQALQRAGLAAGCGTILALAHPRQHALWRVPGAQTRKGASDAAFGDWGTDGVSAAVPFRGRRNDWLDAVRSFPSGSGGAEFPRLAAWSPVPA
jgi:hypothetical protein